MTGSATANFAALIVSLPFLVAVIPGQPPAPVFRDRVVDAITFKDGTRLDGFVLQDKPLTFLVRTEWLQSQHAEFFETGIRPLLVGASSKQTIELAGLLDQEAAVLKAPPHSDPARAAMLSELAGQLRTASADLPALINLEVPRERVRRVDKQPDARRELGRLALLNRITDFESRSYKSVAADLQEIPQQNLLTSPPPETASTDRLPRILAAVDVQAGAAMRLIRQGDLVLDESRQADAAQLIPELLASQVQQSLTALLEEPGLANGGQAPANRDRLPDSAARMAAATGKQTIVLSESEFDLTAGTANVSRRLFRKVANDWVLVLSAGGQASTADVDPNETAALASDPQVKGLLDSFRAFGVDESQFTVAMQMGAVVQNALQVAEAGFQDAILKTTSGQVAFADSKPVDVRLPGEPVPR
jgi:hypothetical protein